MTHQCLKGFYIIFLQYFATDSKPSEGDIEKEHNGNTAVTSAPGTSGPTPTCDRIVVSKPINDVK